MYKASVLLILFVLSLSKSVGQEKTLISQLNKSLIPLDSSLYIIQKYHPQRSAELFKTLNSFSVLGLGEATHGTHEFFVAKSKLILQLIKQGHYDRIGIEAPFAEVEDINQFILNKKGKLREILKTLRQYTYETREFTDLIDAIQVYNESARIKVLFFGFDFQSPFKVMQNLRSFAKDNQEAVSVIDSLSAAYTYLSNELYSHQIDPAVYKDLLRSSRLLYHALEKNSDPQLQRNLNNYKQFMHLNDPEVFQVSIERASTVRDSMMASNVLTELNTGHNLLIWAHNAHVQFSANKFSKSMGQFLKEKLQRQYGAIGLTTYQGFYTAYNTTANAVIQKNPLKLASKNDLEYYLNQAQYRNYLLPRGQIKLPDPIHSYRLLAYGASDNQFAKGNMIDDFNYILFLSKTSGSFNYYLKPE